MVNPIIPIDWSYKLLSLLYIQKNFLCYDEDINKERIVIKMKFPCKKMKLEEFYNKLIESAEQEFSYELSDLIKDLSEFQNTFRNSRYNQYFESALNTCEFALKLIKRDFPEEVKERGIQYVSNVQSHHLIKYIKGIFRETSGDYTLLYEKDTFFRKMIKKVAKKLDIKRFLSDK